MFDLRRITATSPSTSELAQYTDSQLATAAANIAAQFDQIRNRLTPELQNQPLNSPEVRKALNGCGALTPNFSIFSCSFAVAQAALSIGVPVAKIYRIAKEFGGITDFITIVFEFVRNGTFPAGATDEAVDLILSLSGVGGIISSCL